MVIVMMAAAYGYKKYRDNRYIHTLCKALSQLEYLLIPGTETRSFFLLTRCLDMTATASWTMLEIVIVILSDKLTMNVVKICDNM